MTYSAGSTGHFQYRVTSDINYKENITFSDEKYLDRLSNLSIINFDWNRFLINNTALENRYENRNIGISAQELETEIPELVENIEYLGRSIKSINVMSLFTVLIRSIQELKNKNDDLEGKVNLIAKHLELAI